MSLASEQVFEASDQTIDLVGDLDKGTKLGEIADLALDHAPHGVGDGQLFPGIALGLTQRMADPALRKIELLVTLDPFMSATSRLAHYVIAPRLCLEVPGLRVPAHDGWARG